MKCALYLRVSTENQNTDNQLINLERYCHDKGWDIAGIYQEKESAWKAGHQSELARLLNDIRRGLKKYDAVVVWSLDRLSRQGPLAVLQLIDTFKSYQVKVVSVREPFTDVPNGFDSVMYSLVAWVAQFESQRRSERTLAGLARVKANGVKLGRPTGRKDSQKRHKKRPVVFKYGGVGINSIVQ